MPSFDSQIGSAVGKQPALNRTQDQTVITNLLSDILPENGGPTSQLPSPTAGGQATSQLVDAIFNFQRRMVSNGFMPQSKNDGRVDPNGTTLGLMNRFAGFKGNGGGQLPNRPSAPSPTLPPPPAPVPEKGPGFLQPIFAKMLPRPTNWKIEGTGGISVSASTFGFVNGFMSVSDSRKPIQKRAINMFGAGLSLGPAPFGVEIAPGNFPSMGTLLHAGPRQKKTVLEFQELLGVSLLISASVSPGLPAGGNATTILFNIGSNRPLQTLAFDILNSLNSNTAISFLTDAFNTCRAWASTAGVFAGVSIGVSLIEVKLFGDNIF